MIILFTYQPFYLAAAASVFFALGFFSLTVFSCFLGSAALAGFSAFSPFFLSGLAGSALTTSSQMTRLALSPRRFQANLPGCFIFSKREPPSLIIRVYPPGLSLNRGAISLNN